VASRTTKNSGSELEMVRRQAGVNPVWAIVSREPSIACCSVAGSRRVATMIGDSSLFLRWGGDHQTNRCVIKPE
jgi:hypothetical protein